jgi:RHS repeat-associated protein
VSTGTTTEYAGNFIYKDGTLEMFSHPEGYVEQESAGKVPVFAYAYQYKDHLGNIRLTYMDVNQNNKATTNLEIIEENNYYPFGLKHKGYNDVVSANVNSVSSKFKYNGKELEESLGYDMHEYEARHYDAALGRFVTIDPLAEDYNFQTPYSYAINNPIRFIDKFGMGPIFDEDGNVIGYEVEDGQGPSHIAEDLTNLGIYQEDIDFLDIVSLNKDKFKNVKNKEDINDKEYTRLNLNEGEVINVPSDKFGGNLIVTNDSEINESTTTEEQFGSYERDRTNEKKLKEILAVSRTITPDPLSIAVKGIVKLTNSRSTSSTSSRSNTRSTQRSRIKNSRKTDVSSLKGKSIPASEASSSGSTRINSWNQFLKQTKGTYSGKGWQLRAAADYKKLKAEQQQ